MKTIIYYFTGTGNSYMAAKAIAAELQAELVSIPSVMGQRQIAPDADCVGIVFPVYYADAPGIVLSFAAKLTGLSSKYVFAVCTYGGGKGSAIRSLKASLNSGKIAASYGAHMPQNAFEKPREDKDKLYERAKRMTRLIAQRTLQKKKGFVASEWVIDMLQRPSVLLIRPIMRKYLIDTTKGSKKYSKISLINRLDILFSVNEGCIGCGICAKACPAANILMQDGKPAWQHRCENCLACYNICPQKAILSQIAQKGYRYLNPEFSLNIALQPENQNL